jgi:hypothetical protein
MRARTESLAVVNAGLKQRMFRVGALYFHRVANVVSQCAFNLRWRHRLKRVGGILPCRPRPNHDGVICLAPFVSGIELDKN